MTDVVVRGDLVPSIVAACKTAGVREPTTAPTATGGLVQPTVTVTWTPDLTAQEQSTIASIVKLAVGSTLLTTTERAALETDISNLRAYDAAPSPTNAQTVTAVKSIIHVLRAFVRD